MRKLFSLVLISTAFLGNSNCVSNSIQSQTIGENRCPANDSACDTRLTQGSTEPAATGEASSATGEEDGGTCDLEVSSVNVLDIEDKVVLRDMDVRIANGRIKSITKHSDNSSCRESIDGKNRFLMPGLVDMHTHANAIYLPRPGDYERITNVIPLSLKQSGKMLLTAGVTAFLDLCSVPQDKILGMRDQQRRGSLPFDMPDIYSAGSCITAKWKDKAGDPAQFNREAEIADVTLLEKVDDHRIPYPRDDEGRFTYGYMVREKDSELAKIDALLAKRPDVLKVFYTVSWDEGAHLPSLHIDTIKEIVRRAHALKIPVLAHALTKEEQLKVLHTGVDGLAHAAWDFLDRRDYLLRTWRPTKPLIVIPTTTVLIGPDLILDKDKTELNDPLLVKVLSSVRLNKRVQEEFRHMNSYTKEKMKVMSARFWLRFHESVPVNMKIYKTDPRFEVLAGDDASNLAVFLGFGMHQELASMVNNFEYSVWDALASATIRPAKFLNAKYGTKVGDVANLILLRNSPLLNIKNTRNIEKVILHGKAL